jgi:hypothetical protein
MKKILFSSFVLVLTFAVLSSSALAQRETDKGIQVEKDIMLLRRDLRAEKKKLIAMNVPLTETEATKFWPVYDQYAEDMRKHNDEFFTLIKDYAANQKTLTDEQAVSMMKRWTDLQLEVAKTRQRYVPLFEKVIPGKKAAHFLQIDRRIYLIMDLQTASEIPLVLQ